MGNCCERDKIPEINVKDNQLCNNIKCHTKCLSSCCINKASTGHHHHKKRSANHPAD